ncbi:MAG: hypothetical protein H5T86_15485 [Armatimonadetes bacterium]|nr:hypothetical protein [Armatimonadota bacterium]
MVATLRDLLADLPVVIKQGKGVDVSPAGTSKETACRWAERLHPQLHGTDLDWGRVLYVEDAATGSEAAAYIACRGGTVAAVGNAEPAFKETVLRAGGIVCDQSGERGVLEAIRRWLAA